MTKEVDVKIKERNSSIDALDNAEVSDDVKKALHDTIGKGGDEGAEGINATNDGSFDLNDEAIAVATEVESLIGASAVGDDLNTRSSGANGKKPSSTSDVAASKDTDEAEDLTAAGALTSGNKQVSAASGGSSRKIKGAPSNSASKLAVDKDVVDAAAALKGKAAAQVAKHRTDKSNNDEDIGSTMSDDQETGAARRDSVAKLISASKVVAHTDRESDVADPQQENEGLSRAKRTSRKRKAIRRDDSDEEDDEEDEDEERANEGGIPPPPPGAADGQYQYPYQYYPYSFPHPDSYKNGAPPPGVPPPPPPGAAGVPPPPPPADDEGSDKDGKDKDGEGRSQQSAAAAAAAAAAAHYGYQYYPYYYQMYAAQQGGQYPYPAGPRYPYYAGYGNYDGSGQHPMLPTEDGKTAGGHGSDSDHKKDRPSKKRKGESSNGAMASTERPYPCQFQGCHWSFARISDQRRHLRSHQEPTFHCPYWPSDPTCHKNKGAFNRLDVLKRHLRLVHFVQFKQSDSGWCRVCQKMFPSPKHFVDHCEKCAQAARPTEWQVNDNRELVQTGRGRGNVTVTDSQIGPDDPTIYSMGGNASQEEDNEEANAKVEDEEERVAAKVRVARPPTSNRQTLSNAIQAGHHAGQASTSPPPSSTAK